MSSLFDNNKEAMALKIVARSVINNTNVYTLQMGSSMRYATELGLYDVVILEGLMAAGYKIIGYNGKIQCPDGTRIQEIVETPCMASKSIIQLAFEMENSVLSEQEAASYFSRDVEIASVEFKKGTDEIKTREELEMYLANWENADRLGLAYDYRPLNSFVATDALYEVRELAEERVARFYSIICKRRKFPDYFRFEQMIAFLRQEGVLSSEYTMEDVQKAYFSWGMCGIKTPVISTEYKMGLTCSIYNKMQTSSGTGVGHMDIGLMDASGKIFYDEGVVDLSSYEDEVNFGTSKVKPADVNLSDSDVSNYRKSVYFKLKSEPWDTAYKPIKLLTYETYNRTFIKFLDSDGVSYEGRFSPSSFCIVTVSGSFRVIAHGSFFEVLGVDKDTTPLKRCDTRGHYETWQILKAKARDIVRNRTKEPPVKSSFELFLKEGVSPAAATAWAGYMLEKDPNADSSGIPYSRADVLYMEGPDQKYIGMFNPKNYEYNDIDELTEIFKATRDEMLDEKKYLLVKNIPESVMEDKPNMEALADRPVELLEFAKGFKDGEVNVGHFAEGLRKDGLADYDMCTRFLWTVTNIQGLTEVHAIKDVMFSIESSELFDIDKVFRYRDEAYQGYLRDRAELNGKRAASCVNAVVVTRVFREGSNAPISEQHHYMFECIMLDLSGRGLNARGEYKNQMVYVQNMISDAIVRAVNKSKESDIFKECIGLEAPSLALNVMFSIMQGKTSSIGSLMDNVIIKVRLYDKDFEVVIPGHAYSLSVDKNNYTWGAQCTLYDWCNMELPGSQWCMYCLNANITPWEVTPKGETMIPTYNFKLNYVVPEVIAKLPESYRNDLAASTSEPKVLCIQKTYRSRTLVPADELEFISYDDSNINSVLDIDALETPEEYYKRILVCMKRKSEGLYLKRVPLKSDIIYKNWWNCFYEGSAPTEVEWSDNSSDIGLGFLTFQVVQVGSKAESNKLVSSENTFRRWFIEDQRYSDVVKWSDLIRGAFKPQGAVVVAGNRINIQTANGKLCRNVKELTLDDAIKLTEKGLAYQLAAREFVFLSRGQYYYLQIL